MITMPEVKFNEVAWAAVIEQWRAAFQGMSKAANGALREINHSMLAMSRGLREAANSEVVVSGQESRFYVRSLACTLGLEDGDALVRSVLDGTADDMVALMTPANRARVAAALIRGLADDGAAVASQSKQITVGGSALIVSIERKPS